MPITFSSATPRWGRSKLPVSKTETSVRVPNMALFPLLLWQMTRCVAMWSSYHRCPSLSVHLHPHTWQVYDLESHIEIQRVELVTTKVKLIDFPVIHVSSRDFQILRKHEKKVQTEMQSRIFVKNALTCCFLVKLNKGCKILLTMVSHLHCLIHHQDWRHAMDTIPRKDTAIVKIMRSINMDHRSM